MLKIVFGLVRVIVEPPDRRKWPLERGGGCREDSNKSQCIMDFFVRPEIKKKKKHVAVSGGSTIVKNGELNVYKAAT